MIPPRIPLVISVILATLPLPALPGIEKQPTSAGLSADEDREIKSLQADHKSLLLQATKEEWTRPLAKLQEQYLIRMEQLQKQFAKAGNLEKALAARSIARAGKFPAVADSEVQEIASAQEIFLRKQDQFRSEQRKRIEILTGQHVAKLNSIKLKLTRAGRLDGALIVEKQIQSATRTAAIGQDSPVQQSLPEEGRPVPAQLHWKLQEVDHSLGILGAQACLDHDREGQPAIAYFDDITNNLKFATLKGGKWHVITVASTGNVGFSPSLRFSPEAQPAISYFDLNNGELKFTTLNKGEWIQNTVDNSSTLGHSTSLSFGKDGQPAVSYYDLTNKNLKFAGFDGTKWHLEAVDSGGDVGRYSSLVHGPDGHPSIAYYDTTNGDLKFASFDGNQWINQVIDKAGNVGRYSALDYSPAGLPSIAYRDNGAGNLKFADFDGTKWNLSVVDSEGDVGKYNSLKYSPEGQAAISYYDATHGDLKLATGKAGSWTLQKLDHKGDVGWFTSLSYSSAGQPSVAYRDNTGTSLKIASQSPLPAGNSPKSKSPKP
jgi:hypothetical protein